MPNIRTFATLRSIFRLSRLSVVLVGLRISLFNWEQLVMILAKAGLSLSFCNLACCCFFVHRHQLCPLTLVNWIFYAFSSDTLALAPMLLPASINSRLTICSSSDSSNLVMLSNDTQSCYFVVISSSGLSTSFLSTSGNEMALDVNFVFCDASSFSGWNQLTGVFYLSSFNNLGTLESTSTF